MAASGEFQVQGWDENDYEERPGELRLTEAIVEQQFTGDLEGTGRARWLMSYAADGTATFVGLQLVDGVLQGRRGSVVFETRGTFDGKVAKWTARVADGSATGEIEGLGGSGTFEAPMGSTATFQLDVQLP